MRREERVYYVKDFIQNVPLYSPKKVFEELEKEKQREKLKELHSTKKEIGWGSQIRSYVLHPYKMIKDHRTEYETGNVDPVLDGDLSEFIKRFLLFSAKEGEDKSSSHSSQ